MKEPIFSSKTPSHAKHGDVFSQSADVEEQRIKTVRFDSKVSVQSKLEMNYITTC